MSKLGLTSDLDSVADSFGDVFGHLNGSVMFDEVVLSLCLATCRPQLIKLAWLKCVADLVGSRTRLVLLWYLHLSAMAY